MNWNIRLFHIPKKISTVQLAELAFVMFFAYDFFARVAKVFLGSLNLASIVVMMVTYSLVLMACIRNKSKYVKFDFLVLYFGLLTFLLVTYLLHPEYGPYYARETFGVWDHVLSPHRGIYAYLFIRLLNDPKRIRKCMKISGWLMFLYFANWMRSAMARGYWTGVAGTNGSAEMAYSVAFGYNVLLFCLFFLYDALSERKLPDIIATAISLAMILVGGSRGPILFLGVFVALYVLTHLMRSRKKFIIIILIVAVSAFVFVFYDALLLLLARMMSAVGVSSRFITMLISGKISSDNGRNRIWAATIEMIREKPWGYGAMGSRFRLASIIYAGYPHNVILEILVDYGVVIGSVILVFLAVNSWRMLFMNKYREWLPVFLPLFSCACSMMISLTYWAVPAFWASIAVGYSCMKQRKQKGRVNAVEGQ